MICKNGALPGNQSSDSMVRPALRGGIASANHPQAPRAEERSTPKRGEGKEREISGAGVWERGPHARGKHWTRNNAEGGKLIARGWGEG